MLQTDSLRVEGNLDEFTASPRSLNMPQLIHTPFDLLLTSSQMRGQTWIFLLHKITKDERLVEEKQLQQQRKMVGSDVEMTAS